MARLTPSTSGFRLRRSFALQVAASLAAAICVAALFNSNAPAPTGPAATADVSKMAHRIANAQNDVTVLRFDAQQQAALASIASFQPTAAPEPLPPLVTAPRAKVATVRPPPRPSFNAGPAPAAAPPAQAVPVQPPAGWHVAGMEIPGSAKVRQFVPSGSDILRTGDAAWNASAGVVKKVAGLGSLFGL